jgi:hypothetical protein
MLRALRDTVVAAMLVSVAVAGLTGCEKTNHDNIDKWTHTTKGPGKLRSALKDSSIDADLSAHAAANLIRTSAETEVFDALRDMSPPRRDEVIDKLVPRLWDTARLEGEMVTPSPAQTTSKDALFELRDQANPDTKAKIDEYLTDWYTGGYYEARANQGKFIGCKVLRSLGAKAGAKLMAAANAILAKPINGTTRAKVGDELLLGMAASGSPEAVNYVLDIARMNRGDKTQGPRAMSALFKAYLEPGGLFDVVPPAALAPNVEKLAEIAKDSTVDPGMANDAVALIRAAGMPYCLAPLLSMINQLHREADFRYVGANSALRCGGLKAVNDVVAALPDSGMYELAEVTGAVAGEIAKMTPRDQTLTLLRQLLAKKTKMTRWIAMETLLLMKSKDDIAAISELSSDGSKLTGFWGDQSNLDAKARKSEPTVGKRAGEIAAALKTQP